MRNSTRFGKLVLLLGLLILLAANNSFAGSSDPLATWYRRDTSTLNKVAYGNGTFVTVGDLGTILSLSDGVTWKQRVSLTSNTLHGVTYANGTFVAVGDSGTILTSTDGKAWEMQASGTLNHLTGVIYGNGVFVTVAKYDGTILTSTDGIAWEQVLLGTSDEFEEITYGNGMFVAVGGWGTIMTSTDGVTWQEQASGTYFWLNDVTYGNGQFIVAGNAGTILSSPDGVTWQKQVSGTSNEFIGITYGNGIFIAVGQKGMIMTSADGVSWTEQASGASNDLYGITYGNSRFLAVGWHGTVLTSFDGILWEMQSSGAGSLTGITYGNGAFVAVGSEIPYNHTATVLTSPDGVTWKSHLLETNDYQLSCVTFGSGMFVATGGDNNWDYGLILSSPDGVTWQTQTSRAIHPFNGVTYGNGMFVALGGGREDGAEPSGSILTSTDGITWESQSPSTSYVLHGVTYGRGMFVAVGGGYNAYYTPWGTILTSTDGVTWEKRLEGTMLRLFGVTYGNGTFVAVGYDGTILTSTDGFTWESRSAGTTYWLKDVTYGNGRFVIVGDSGTILTSPDGVKWKLQSSGTSNSLNGVKHRKGTFTIVGEGGVILQSNPIYAIESAMSTTASGYYKEASSINITLNFSAPLSSTGLIIKLNSGGSIKTGPFSNLTSYSGTYLATSGENTAALNITSIIGKITLADGLTATPVVPAGRNIADLQTIVVDTAPPTVTISNPSVSGTVSSRPVTYTVTYTDKNFYSSVLAARDITLNKTGTADGVVSAVMGTGKKFTVTIDSITGCGTLGISIGAGTAIDKAGNIAYAVGPSTTFDVDTPPTLGTLSPSSLTSSAGSAKTFIAIYSDVDGYADLKSVDLLVSPTRNKANAIWVRYRRTTNMLYLASDAGTFSATGCTPGAAGFLSNSQGTLDCQQTTVAGSGNMLTVKWNITPNTAFQSPTPKKLWMIARDNADLSSGLIQKGSWTINP